MDNPPHGSMRGSGVVQVTFAMGGIGWTSGAGRLPARDLAAVRGAVPGLAGHPDKTRR